jgi:Zn-dependent protease
MLRSWKLGTAFGIGIYVHWTFLLLIGFVLFHNWDLGGMQLALYAVSLLGAVFGCVVLHELGHALMARQFGIPTRDITLYPIGGVARLERMSERPWEEFWIAVAGPAVNVVIAGVLFVLLSLTISFSLADPASIQSFLRQNYLFDLMVINALLVAFNLLPAFPMDGGRVLRALLVPPLGRLRATEIAANVGAVFAVLIGLLALLTGSPMPILVAAFVFFAGRQELAAVRYRDYLRRAEPLDALPAEEDIIDVIPVPEDTRYTGTLWNPEARAWVIWRNGRPVHTYRVD